MTTENTIITDLSGEKKEKVQKQFKAKGIPTLLSEVNFKNNAGLSDVEDVVVLNKIITSIKRVFKKDFLSKSTKEQLNYFKKLKINKSYTVEMQEYKGNNIKQKSFSRIRTQLHNRLIAEHRETITKEDLIIVKITIKSGKYTQEGFSVLNAELQPHRHRKKGEKDYYRYYDATTLIAEVLAIQSLLSFASKSKRTIQYLFLENSFDAKTNTLSLPSKEIFKNEILKVAKKYKFNVKKTVVTKELDFKKYLFDADISYNEPDRLKDFKTDELLLLISKEFIKESGYIQYTIDAQTKQRSSYAKSFETKKQINKDHRSASVINSFLRRYGKSEIDNDVLLEKFGDTQRYFRELSEVIHIPYSKEHTFRIKRLGKLRAAGVYYPHCKTTIFDRKHSYAYVHELGHQIDHMLASCFNSKEEFYSQTFEFRPIYNYYKELILDNINNLPKEDSFLKDWYGKKKYNRNYYLQPVEVFARCFEIYLSQFNLRNGLLLLNEELEKKAEYTLDPDFITFITPFFENIMEVLKKEFPIPENRTYYEPLTNSQTEYFPIPAEDFNATQLSLF